MRNAGATARIVYTTQFSYVQSSETHPFRHCHVRTAMISTRKGSCMPM